MTMSGTTLEPPGPGARACFDSPEGSSNVGGSQRQPVWFRFACVGTGSGFSPSIGTGPSAVAESMHPYYIGD